MRDVASCLAPDREGFPYRLACSGDMDAGAKSSAPNDARISELFDGIPVPRDRPAAPPSHAAFDPLRTPLRMTDLAVVKSELITARRAYFQRRYATPIVWRLFETAVPAHGTVMSIHKIRFAPRTWVVAEVNGRLR